ncbi:MAG: FAD-dependent oxidoreductase [Bacilli bacterium]|nr:FAD-dependent oxidoreductase [Bacilli bacterium]
MKYKNISIWSDAKQENVCENLSSNIDVDVLIIGGGITGLSTAYHLINSNLKVCLVDKNEIASGVTCRTTGKLTYLQENILSKVAKYHGISKAKDYLDSQIDAINLVKAIITKENISCDLQEVSSYIFSNDKVNKIKKEMDLLNKLNVKLEPATTLPNGKCFNYGFFVKDTYVFHPIKYLHAIKNICLNNNINIYENTKVISINYENSIYECVTETGTIKAKYVVLAMHYPYFLFPFLLPLKTTIEKSYIKAYEVSCDNKFSAITISKPTISMRFHQTKDKCYQLYLNNSHNSCVKFNDKECFKDLTNVNNQEPEYLWSNKDIITNDALPFIGPIDDTNTLLIGTGYNTWGMTNGSIAGKILSDIILNKENKYVKLFSPKRSLNLGKIINLPVSIGSSACAIVKTKIHKNKEWYPDNVRFETRKGKNIAIYTDENKKEHIVYNICPHLKCSLLFNDVEKTWDCPCHGSRFDIDGNTIEGPSNYNITYKDN